MKRRSLLGATASLLAVGNPALLAGAATERAGVKPVLSRDIEPLVRLLEETPRELLLETVAQRIRQGLGYRQLLAALLLAGVRNIEARPVGFKFHAVMVVISVHLASRAIDQADRWLPIFWALDYFKYAQARDVREGDWHLGAVDEAAVPPAHKAKRAFIDAMDRWDVETADAAVAGFARAAGLQQIFEVFSRFGARDFRDIGHKAIYVAGAWRALSFIGPQYAEPVLRSLAYALLNYDGANPAESNDLADRAWRDNRPLVSQIGAGWQSGKPDTGATGELLATLREGSPVDASRGVVQLLNHGLAPRSIWDALICGAAELLMRDPGIVSLHAVTSTNALYFAYRTVAEDPTRRLLMLQNAAFLPIFRGAVNDRQAPRLDRLEPMANIGAAAEALDHIFADVNNNHEQAVGKAFGFLHGGGEHTRFADEARRLIVLKTRNAHDYKFSSAVLEDYNQLSPVWRERFLAASVVKLRGNHERDNELVERTREALKG